MRYVNVIIDNKSDMTDIGYTYLCKDEFAFVGNMVTVPFGRGTGEKRACIIQVMDKDYKYDGKFKLKEVSFQLETPLTEEIVETCKWMKNRYFCRFYDCIELFLPAGKKPTRAVKSVHSEPIEHKNQIENLTEEQETAVHEIGLAIERRKQELFLLHGVTGSGKTQVFISAIEKLMKEDTTKSAIMLVPEISLTKQIIDRVAAKFGEDKIAVLHSRLTKAQRYEQWENIRSGNIKIVIGARSAVFAPLENIGLIILDEEHESTYKSDKTPKYDTVEVAIKRTKAEGGSVILGSATPSVISFQRAKEGIYKYIQMTKRYNNTNLPDVKVIDISDELKSGNKSTISRELYNQINRTLNEKKQVILFLNRRGYATYIACTNCDYKAVCEDCEINLTYHKETETLDCHYCGKKIKSSKICPKCGDESVMYRGFGTEKVEEEIIQLFEGKTIERLDLDTSQRVGHMEKVLRNFGKGKIDILMGTQIVAKGLDFHNVGLVGILAADTALNIPDYRAAERCFQLITQAAGRAGRGDETGLVVVQTFNPDNYAIIHGTNQDYSNFFKQEIALRKYMEYPPFSDLVQIVLGSNEERIAHSEALLCREVLISLLGKGSEINIYAVQQMVSINKEITKYYILVKCPRAEKANYMGAIKAMKENIISKKKNKKYGKADLQISIDINPFTIWRG